MSYIQPEESIIMGAWIEEDGQIVADANCRRIEKLISERLTIVSVGDWEGTYYDSSDGRYWKLTYPHSHMHGGGPPRLDNIEKND